MVVAVKVVTVEEVEEQVAESQGIVTKKTKKGTCVHHWLIEEGTMLTRSIGKEKKPTSAGRCKKCHAVKEFNNYTGSRSEFTWPHKPSGRKTK